MRWMWAHRGCAESGRLVRSRKQPVSGGVRKRAAAALYPTSVSGAGAGFLKAQSRKRGVTDTVLAYWWPPFMAARADEHGALLTDPKPRPGMLSVDRDSVHASALAPAEKPEEPP